MDDQLFEKLLSKYIVNDITKEELDLFLSYIDFYDTDYLIKKFGDRISFVDLQTVNIEKNRAIFSKIESSIDVPASKSIFHSYHKYMIACAALLLMLLGAVLYLNYDTKQILNVADHNDVFSSDEHIKIHTDDGQKIILDDSTKQYYQLGNMSIAVNPDGMISYSFDQKNGISSRPVTIETPKGKQSYLELEDGSKVWLNAMSKLVFNPSFSDSERLLRLEGEAYFEVMRDPKRPFVVQTNRSNVQVLGTGFNVCAYPEETEQTTLVHGKVKVNTANRDYVLSPNQQLTNTDQGTAHIEQVDVSEFSSWRSGFLEFHKKDIKQVLAQLNKWYDIKDVVIRRVTEDTFTGTFKHDRSLRNVLNQLELVSDYRFKINNGIVYID